MVLGTAAPAAGQVACGDTLGPGGTFTLESDLECDEDPALTLVGPVALDLNGFELACTGGAGQVGLELQESRVEVSGGTLRGCETAARTPGPSSRHHLTNLEILEATVALSLNGDRMRIEAVVIRDVGFAAVLLSGSRNRIEGILVQDLAGLIGLRVEGDRNRIENSALLDVDANTEEPVRIVGDRNLLRHNTVRQAEGDGPFPVVQVIGDGNRLEHNRLRGNGDDEGGGPGLRVNGARNRVSENSVANAGTPGLSVTGDRNRVSANAVSQSGTSSQFSAGISLAGTRSRLEDNVSSHNLGAGIWVAGTGHRLSGNRALASFGEILFPAGITGRGIHVSGEGHRLRDNAAVGSENEDLVDASGCTGGNRWKKNVFGTSNPPAPSCIE